MRKEEEEGRGWLQSWGGADRERRKVKEKGFVWLYIWLVMWGQVLCDTKTGLSGPWIEKVKERKLLEIKSSF